MSLEEALHNLTEATRQNTEIQRSLLAKLTTGSAAKGGEKDEVSSEAAPATRRRRTTEKQPDEVRQPATVDKPVDKPADDPRAIYTAVKSFINFGEDDNEEDQDERSRRAKFVTRINNHFDAARASEIPLKHANTVKRWLKIFEAGDKVDFEVD